MTSSLDDLRADVAQRSDAYSEHYERCCQQDRKALEISALPADALAWGPAAIGVAIAFLASDVGTKVAGALLALAWCAAMTCVVLRSRRRNATCLAQLAVLRGDLHDAEQGLGEAIDDILLARYAVELGARAGLGCVYLVTTPRGLERVEYVEVDGQPRLLRGDTEVELAKTTPPTNSKGSTS